MKKIEKLLFNFCSFISESCRGYFAFLLVILLASIAFLIHKHRKKDAQDIEDQNIIDNFFNINNFKHNETEEIDQK